LLTVLAVLVAVPVLNSGGGADAGSAGAGSGGAEQWWRVVSGADGADADSAGANSGCGGEWRVVLTVWVLTVLMMLVLTVPMTA